MLGTPFSAGTLTSVTSSATYSVPVTTPVPPGAAIVVFAGASGSTAATGVTDSQGNTYTLGPSSTANEWLQAFTATGVTGLNPLAGDTWTVTYAAANTQGKNIIAIAVTGAAAFDFGTHGSGSSASPSSVSANTATGNEILIGCIQTANSGGVPAAFSQAQITALSPSGQPYSTAGYTQLTAIGGATFAETIISAPWAVAIVAFTASAPVALGTGMAPSGGATLPPYPVLPNPRTWSAEDQILAPLLRGDPGNAITLLANPPVYTGGQTTTGQSVPSGAVTALNLDTDLSDNWAMHQQPNTTVAPALPGWYLCEGFVNQQSVAGAIAACGIQAVQGGVTTSSDGGKVTNTGSNNPVPACADLVQLNPAASDTVALYAFQNSGSAKVIGSAYLKAEWVSASSGTAVPSPVPAAGWTSGATTLLTAVAAGATSAVAADPAGIAAGGVIALGYGTASAESVTVTSVSGQTIGFTACAYPHPSGAPVSVPVSAAFMNQQARDKIRLLAWRPVARLSNQGVSQSLTAQAWPAGTAVTWANPGSTARCTDSYGGWAAGNPTRYTFPLPGNWYLYGQVYLTDAASAFPLAAGIAVSGGTIQWGDRFATAGASGTICATVRRVLRVTAGQYAEICGSQSSGTLALQNSGSTLCKFLAVWRGF